MIISTMNILIADDNKRVRAEIVSLIGEEPGFNVIGEAQNGLEALQKVQKLKPDILIIDMKMPGLNGVEVIRRVKRLFPDVRIVGLSMYEFKTFVVGAIAAGASGYILKKHPENIVEALNTIMEGERYLSPELQRYFS